MFNFIDTVIQLPINLFFGTTIATCILVLKKNKVDNNILFIDASEEYENISNKNKLNDKNIENIVNLVKERNAIEGKSYLASYDEIKNNDYNISVSSYIKKKIEEENIDINEVNIKLEELFDEERKLKEEIHKIISEIEGDLHA